MLRARAHYFFMPFSLAAWAWEIFRVDVVHLDGLRSWSSTSRALDFVDSYGLRELVVTRKRQQEIGGDVILRSPTKRTLRTLEIVGLTQVFTIA